MLAAAAVAVAVVLASVGAYVAVRSELRGQVDDSLEARAGHFNERIAAAPGILPADAPPPPELGSIPAPPDAGADVLIQTISPDGEVAAVPGGAEVVPANADVLRVAEGDGDRTLSDETVDDTHVRVLAVPLPKGGAVQILASLEGVDDVLADLRVILVLICLAGVAVAALVARALANRVVGPIAELSDAAEHISATDDLSRRIEVDGDDEVARLASRFNAMLDGIERSQEALTTSLVAQSQLVADASHELRTPIASLRTDVESLIAHPELAEEERERRLVEVEARAEELTALVTDVIELARGDAPAGEPEEVRLDDIAADSIAWLARHAPERVVESNLEPSVVEGRPDRIGRAINNLLDNAHKYSPPGEPIEVAVADSEVTVRDHGPGVPSEEREQIFARFHRGSGPRRVAGSGLGLAIVRQVAESHGGSASVEAVDGGAGARFRLRLVSAPASAP